MDVVHNTSWDGHPLEKNSKGALPLKIKVDLTHAIESYKALETAITKLEKTYLEG